MSMIPGWLTTRMAAEILGVSTQRVRRMADDGVLVARKFDAVWAVQHASVLRRLREHPRPGRPRKNS